MTAAGSGVLIAAVITCSDSAAAGLTPDTSGPLAAEQLKSLGFSPGDRVAVVPDEVSKIARAVRAAIDSGARIVVTTGGTGVGPRDVTPEALRGMGLRELPGLGELIRARGRAHLPAADLSRALAGVLDSAVILALPGSPGGVRDGLAIVGGLLGHAAAVAGGAGHPRARQPGPGVASLIRAEPISEAEVASAVASPQAGAVVTFTGVVRDHDHGRPVAVLEYEAHPDANAVVAEVVAQAAARPRVIAAAALHRVGNLAVGELAFVAAISAAHRVDAFAACAWLVDAVKARVPIWKHQYFADGTDEWVNSA